MEEFVIIASKKITDQEEVIYSNNKGAVIKTILLSAPTQKETTLTFDGVSFSFLAQKETTIISTPILTKEIKAFGGDVNLHITGLEL